LHCNIYLAFKMSLKICSPWWKAWSQQNVNIASLFAQLAVTSVQQIFGIRVTIDSLQQHEAYKEIYGIDAFTITGFSVFFIFGGQLTSNPRQITPLPSYAQ